MKLVLQQNPCLKTNNFTYLISQILKRLAICKSLFLIFVKTFYMNRKTIIEIIFHIIFWIITLYFYCNYSYFRIHPQEIVKEYYSLLIIIAAVYINFFIITPMFLIKNEKISYFLFIIPILIIASEIEFLLICEDIQYYTYTDDHNILMSVYRWNLYSIFFRDTLFVAFFTMFKIYRDAIKSYKLLQEKTAIEREQYITRIEMVKSKINTHFFFNCLNSIYSFALNKSDETTTLVMKLSRLMEYVVADSDNEWVELDKEINFIKNYIALESVRHPKMNTSFDISGDVSTFKVPPMIFESFVNNAFKYTNLAENGCINIQLECHANEILFTSENSINHKAKEVVTSTGKGLINTRNRLNLHYKDKYQLDIYEKENVFTVKLLLKAF